MKNVLTVLALVLSTSAFAGPAAKRSLQPVFVADLTQLNVDRALTTQTITDANVTLNFMTREVSLVLQPAFNCPTGLICAQVMPQPIQYSVPVISVSKDECGSKTYVAFQDTRTLNGGMTKIELRDNTEATCAAAAALPSTQVALETESSDGSKSRSTFNGDRLVRSKTDRWEVSPILF